MSWCTIESDPGVFTEMISKIGVKEIQVEEIFQVDKETMSEMAPVHGLVFLFKWKKEQYNADRAVLAEGVPGLFFAKQVVTNACATQAILSVLLNNKDIELGETLSSFKEFTADLDPDTRGLAIGNSVPVRDIHNSFARAEPFMFENKGATEDDDVFHFIAYVPHGGRVYELDGMREGPILLGDFDAEKGDSWTDVVESELQRRFSEAQNIQFNLLAIVKDREATINAELEKMKALKARIEAKLRGESVSDESDLPTGNDALQSKLDDIEDEEEIARAKIMSEQHKKAAWKKENVRRRFDFVPFVYNLLKTLAQNGKLKGLREEGLKAAKERTERNEAEKAKAKA